MLLPVKAAAEQGHRRLLVDVLELLGAQPAALREAAGDPQLVSLPFPEDPPDQLRGKSRTATGR